MFSDIEAFGRVGILLTRREISGCQSFPIGKEPRLKVRLQACPDAIGSVAGLIMVPF